MSMYDCINKAVSEGRLSQEKADQVLELFDDFDLQLQNTMHADAAQVEAGRRAYEAMRLETLEKRRRELLRIKTWQRIEKDMRGYRNAKGAADFRGALLAHIDHDEFAEFSNLQARQNAVLGRLHGRMEKVLSTFRRNLVGSVREKATLDDLVREAFGHDTGNASAKELATAWSDTAEFARKRFNAGGGRIPKRDDWGLPQTHDSLRVGKAGYQAWRDFVVDKLDPDRMIDEVTGFSITPEKLEIALREVYETIKSEGLNKLTPSGAASGRSLANRRADHRFLVFKDADAWLAYNRKFGGNDVYSTMMAHIDGMARDIAMLEVLGPNPTATLRYMSQLTIKWGSDTGNLDRAKSAVKLAEDMFGLFTGGTNAPIDGRWARFFAGTRQFVQSSQLGAASLSAITDLNFQRMARAHTGLSEAKLIPQVLKLFTPTATEDQKLAVRLGLIAENWSSIASGQMRYVGDVSGSEISRRLADVVMRASFLSPWTQAGRWAFGMEFMGRLADDAGKEFDALDPALQRTMRKYGIGPEHWDIVRATTQYTHKEATFLRPDDIAGRNDLTPSFADDLAMRVMEMIQTETEFAVPSTSLRGRAAMVSDSRPGTVQGELMRSFAMYKSFSVTLLHTHIRRMVTQKGAMSKARYGANFIISTTLMGALALQLKEMSKGRDPRPMFGDNAGAFWGAALLQGGGLGIIGDFLGSASTNRYGGGLGQTIAGPVFGGVNDVGRLTLGNALEVAQGKDTNIGNDVVNMLRRYTPVFGSLWYARAAYERMFLDEIQKAVDPDAFRRFRRQENRYRREYGQRYWWSPGEALPDRGPDFSNVLEE